MFPAPAYTPPEESFNQDVISTVDKTMKKYTDNLMRFLEGISSRLSQLELYCYNLDKSIGEMRSDLGRDNEEADSKLKSLDKHLQEVSSTFYECIAIFSFLFRRSCTVVYCYYRVRISNLSLYGTAAGMVSLCITRKS